MVAEYHILKFITKTSNGEFYRRKLFLMKFEVGHFYILYPEFQSVTTYYKKSPLLINEPSGTICNPLFRSALQIMSDKR